MTLPEVLDVGDGLTIKREFALCAARHLIAATSLVIDEAPLGEMGMELASINLADVLGGPQWHDYALALIDVAEMEMGR